MLTLKALLALAFIASPLAADQGTDSAATTTPPRKVVPHMNPSIRAGAQVRGTLVSGSTIQGTVLAPFTMDSQRIVVCVEPGQGCSDPGDVGVTSTELAQLSRLSVRGTSRQAGGYIGFFGGALIGLLATGSSSEDAQGLAMVGGAFAGLAVGSFVGSRVRGWQEIFPCYHGCATGEYP